jgi:hypothetical protein
MRSEAVHVELVLDHLPHGVIGNSAGRDKRSYHRHVHIPPTEHLSICRNSTQSNRLKQKNNFAVQDFVMSKASGLNQLVYVRELQYSQCRLKR